MNFIIYLYIYCVLEVQYIENGLKHTQRQRKIIILETYYGAGDIDSKHIIIEERGQRFLSSKAGNIGVDICNFIVGGARKITVLELLDCGSPGGCLGVTKRTVALEMFVTAVPFRTYKLRIDTHNPHLGRAHTYVQDQQQFTVKTLTDGIIHLSNSTKQLLL